jgi:hypothetical protein
MYNYTATNGTNITADDFNYTGFNITNNDGVLCPALLRDILIAVLAQAIYCWLW